MVGWVIVLMSGYGRWALRSQFNDFPIVNKERLVPMNTQTGILCDPASLVLYGRCQAVRDFMRDLERVNRGGP
jgi:hypothetical protein